MKQLFYFSQITKKAIIVIFCFLLLPNSLLIAKGANQTTTSTEKKQDKTLAPSVDPKNLVEYDLSFNRSPIVGNRMRLRGVNSQARLAFTRPRGWNVNTVKAQINFQQSPALYASRSNLTVLVNDTSIGSIPLNHKQSEIGKVLLNIPKNLLQDYNELTIVAQQNDSTECSDPNNPDLWTEILPDSKLIFSFQRQAVPLNFSHYPYPLFDQLGLGASQIAYLEPTQVSPAWLTTAARFQASLGRSADFRPLKTTLVPDVASVNSEQKLVIIGTPSEQPVLSQLKYLPVSIIGNQILDRSQNPVPEDRGVLILTTTKKDSGSPVLIATGNSAKGVAKAVQFLLQPDLRKMGTGQVVFVDQIQEASTPGVHQWPGYLPEQNSFKLQEIKQVNGEATSDVTVRGSGAPAIDIDFHALPDDRFLRGSAMNLVYSYGPQMNPRTSAIEVLMDGVFIGGARLDSQSGESHKKLRVDLPANLIKPDSKLQVFFRMNPKEPFDKQNCISPPDQQLTGTVHTDTSFDLKRETSVELPDLNLLKFGYPFAAPQDLSATAIVVPQNPSDTDILTLLAFSERLGRLSRADTIKLDVYTPNSLPDAVRKNNNLVGIGERDKFPFPEVFNQPNGFNLSSAFLRVSDKNEVQTPQDTQGMIKEIMSPWNSNRVVLALTSQTQIGLERVQQVLNQDPWFFQLKKDTVLISSDQKNPEPYDANAYQLEFFQRAPSTKRIENTNLLNQASDFIQDNWLLLPIGIVGISLLLYGIVQLYLKRVTVPTRK